MSQRLVLALAAALACAGAVTFSAPPPTAALQTSGATLPPGGRSMVMTRLGIVAASHPLAAQAGAAVLERGGNAVDAAIAANAVMGLMEPAMNGIGGDLFVLMHEAGSGRTYGLNAGGWSPAGQTIASLKAKGMAEMPGRGIHAVTVPGAVAGWDALRARFGTRPFSELLAPAIYYAETGFPVTEVVSRGWADATPLLSERPATARTYLPNGRAPRAGEAFTNPGLAQSLKLIADEGRDGFYTGPTAAAIVRLSEELGGAMTLADLAEYQPEWVEPITTTYRGWTVFEIPPNSQGIAALMMLNLMERYPLAEWGFHSARALHVMIEAKKLAYADLLRYVGDPAFSRIPVAAMLDKTRAADRAKLIDMTKAACRVEPSRLDGYTNSQGNDTIYLTAIDKDGNVVSLIQSIYSSFGSGLVPEGTGFALHNRGALFTLEENHPNTLAPRKRPLHTIIPAFMSKGDVKIGFGIMGGFNQAQAHAQFVANIADYGMTIQQALEAGRFTKGSFQGCDVDIEALIPADVRRDLGALGHDIEVVPVRTGRFGWGQAVMTDGTGTHYGASEPRHDGAAIPQMPPLFGR